MHGPLDNVMVQFVNLCNYLKLDASVQQKCLMLCNNLNHHASGPLAILRVSMTQLNNREVYELDFRFLKFQILETEWIHVNDTWNANNLS